MAFINAVCQRLALSKSLTRAPWNCAAVRPFSICCSAPTTWLMNTPALTPPMFKSLLLPSSSLLVPTAGMKQMGKLRKRCKHCFFIMIDERLHIWCDVHPRHKQMQMIPRPKTVIITTHATQGKIRPW